jgi:molybdopterin-guanine dinucleotide biosynthesis protein MobB
MGPSGVLQSLAVRNGPLVIGVVGPSASGKTTLLEGLVRALRESGLWVGVVKHARHDVQADREGKDSARLYEAGADAVALAAPNKVVTFIRREMPPRLADALAGLPPGLDVVLVEGFSWERIPRYVLAPPGVEKFEWTGRGPILRTIPVPAATEGTRPSFSAALVDDLASEIGALAGREVAEGPPVATRVDQSS